MKQKESIENIKEVKIINVFDLFYESERHLKAIDKLKESKVYDCLFQNLTGEYILTNSIYIKGIIPNAKIIIFKINNEIIEYSRSL